MTRTFSVGDFVKLGDKRHSLESTDARLMVFPSQDGEDFVVFGSHGGETFGGFAATEAQAKQAAIDWLNRKAAE